MDAVTLPGRRPPQKREHWEKAERKRHHRWQRGKYAPTPAGRRMIRRQARERERRPDAGNRDAESSPTPAV